MSVLDVFNPNLGVAVREHAQAHSIIRLPRTESLRILPKSGMLDMFKALVACEELSRSSLKRGEARKIFGDGTSGGAPMYSSVGVQASRCGGILERSPRYASVKDQHWKTIVTMTRRAESALESFADTNVLRQLSAAKELVDFKTLSSPNNSHHCVKYFGALAFGRNVFLRCHTDEDFTLSVTQIYLKGRDSYSPTDEPVAFFCFPTRAVAIPMRPGDFLIFDATLPHSISSCCHSADDIMCVSFYLKSRVVGMNDNSIPLSKDQYELSSFNP
jgi:hypothetical protein